MGKKTTQIIISVIIVLVLLVGAFVYFRHGSNMFNPTGSPGSSVQSNLYTNADYGFSLDLPSGAKTSEFAEGEGNTIIISNDKTQMTNGNFQMQIYITPFDEDIVLSADRIKKDIPDLKMGDVKNTEAGGVKAIEFTDQDQNTREIWFVRDGNLFQISSAAGNSGTMEKIVEGWKWK